MDRRRFIVAGLTGTAVSCARSKSPWRFFSVEEARTVEAVWKRRARWKPSVRTSFRRTRIPVRCRRGWSFSSIDSSPDFISPCRKPTGKGSRQSTTREEARTVEAVCAHIIPQDQDPGAVQAGVVVFIDRQLTRFYKPLQKTG